jgi:hypothetical protein
VFRASKKRRAGGIEMNAITRFVKDDSGQDMLEYALLTALSRWPPLSP